MGTLRHPPSPPSLLLPAAGTLGQKLVDFLLSSHAVLSSYSRYTKYLYRRSRASCHLFVTFFFVLRPPLFSLLFLSVDIQGPQRYILVVVMIMERQGPGPSLAVATAILHRRGFYTTNITPNELSQLDTSDKSSLKMLVTVVSAVAMALITSTVVLRLMVRRHSVGRFFLDDCMFLSLLWCPPRTSDCLNLTIQISSSWRLSLR